MRISDANREKPEDWEANFDEDSQCPFWYNLKTGESTWEKPAALGGGGACGRGDDVGLPLRRSVPPSGRLHLARS